MLRRLAVFAVEAVAVDEATDTTHGPAGIGEREVGLKSRLAKLHRSEEKTQVMTPEEYSQWLHLQDKEGIMYIKQREYQLMVKLKIFSSKEKPVFPLMLISFLLFNFIVSCSVQARSVESGVFTFAKQTKWEKQSILASCLALCV